MEISLAAGGASASGPASSSPDTRLPLAPALLACASAADLPPVMLSLSVRQLASFLLLGVDPNIQTVSSLANRLKMPMPGMSRTLDRLQRLRLISRVRAQHDRRVVQIRLTRRGQDQMQQLRTVLIATSRALLADVAKT